MKLPPRPTLVCIGYLCLHQLAHLSARLFEVAPGISVWYPPSGLAFAVLVMLGVRYAGVVLAVNIAGALIFPGSSGLLGAFIYPTLITANYSAAAWFIRRYIGGGLLPESGTGTVAFVAASVAAPLGVSFSGMLVFSLLVHPPASFLPDMLRWWIGDAIGMITIVPVAMVFVAPWVRGLPHPAQRWRWKPRFLAIIAAQLAVLVAALVLVFQQSVLPHGTLYLCFLPLIWTCLRHGLPGACAVTFVLVAGTLIGMHYSPQTDGHTASFFLFAVAASSVGLGLGSAVSRRNEVRRELATSRARFDRVIEGAHAGLWDWNVRTGQVVFNQRCAQLLGRSPSQLAPTWEAWGAAIHTSDRARQRAAFEAHLHGQSPMYECEYRIRTDDQRWRWIHSRGSIVARDENGSPESVSGTFMDITERKLTEGAAQRLLTIVESTTDFVLTIDPHGQIVYANAALLRLLRHTSPSSITGQPFSVVFTEGSADKLQAEVIPAALEKSSWNGELTVRSHNDHEVPVSTAVAVHRVTDDEGWLLSFVMRDVSAQKQNEAERLERERRLLQVQKAESLNILAGGIAHDFNNLLTAILGNASLVRDELPPDDPNRPMVGQIELAANRAAELCHNLLAYAGRVRVNLTELNLNAVVKESRDLIKPAIHKKITLDLDLTDDPASVNGSASQLQQVIVNLILNAQDAIGDRAGRIVLRTRLRSVAEASSASGTGLVCLEVEDTGCGIAESLRDKVFEPFFSTKSTGHGLGLAAANGIVRAHGGSIEVEAAPGGGSVFRVSLPVSTKTAQPEEQPPAGDQSWSGSGLALVVDDEELVREVTARLLEKFGFTTIVAADGLEGVSAFNKHHRELSFVITDLTMPRMSGDEAIAQMRRIDADVPILLMSGYPGKMAREHFAMANPTALLAKPIRPDVLVRILQQVLRKRDPAPDGDLSHPG